MSRWRETWTIKRTNLTTTENSPQVCHYLLRDDCLSSAKHGSVQHAFGSLRIMHTPADVVVSYSPLSCNNWHIWSVGFVLPIFFLLVTCYTEGVICSNSPTTAINKVGQHNCQGNFNLVGRIILCNSPERHSGLLECLLPVICLLSVICSGSKSQCKFYFITYDEHLCVKVSFSKLLKFVIIFLLSWSVHGAYRCQHMVYRISPVMFSLTYISVQAIKFGFRI